MTIRETNEYKEMTMRRMFQLTYSEADSEEETLAFWQKMVDTGFAWEFEGWFGRTALSMIKDGVIEAPELAINLW